MSNDTDRVTTTTTPDGFNSHDARKAMKAAIKEAMTTPGGKVLVLAVIPSPDGSYTRIISNTNPGCLLVDTSDTIHEATDHWLEKQNAAWRARKEATHE